MNSKNKFHSYALSENAPSDSKRCRRRVVLHLHGLRHRRAGSDKIRQLAHLVTTPFLGMGRKRDVYTSWVKKYRFKMCSILYNKFRQNPRGTNVNMRLSK